MMYDTDIQGVEITGGRIGGSEHILSSDAIKFLVLLHKKFNGKRLELLHQREKKQQKIHNGVKLNFLSETEKIRQDSSWCVASTPKDLQKRLVEITGPTERKMVINAMNSGADVFMADFEDANSPIWENMVEGQVNLYDAARREISFVSPEGKEYFLDEKPSVLMVRPRGWHLNEKHFLVDGEEMSGSLFDFGLYFFHNCQALLDRKTGPYFYLAKLEGYLEARLWNEVFVFSQEYCKIPHGSVRATVLVETIHAVFEMEEILYELQDHSAGMNAGRWDYMFSIIKTFRRQRGFTFPDRDQVTMTVPFMRAYTELLVKTCHGRKAHALGGMAAFIPNRRDAEVTERALKKVQEDKEREVRDGFDGTWVAHPDLVSVARNVFAEALGENRNQKERLRTDVNASPEALTNFSIPGGTVSEQGLRHNITIALQYVAAWLQGRGAVAMYNLMEDAATAEISRAQVWQWRQSGVTTVEGRVITTEWIQEIIQEEMEKIRDIYQSSYDEGVFIKSRDLFERLVLSEHFIPFLTLPAYKELP